MKKPLAPIQFMFFSSLMAIIIWLAIPAAKANVKPFPSPYNGQQLSSEQFPFENYEARYKVSWHGVKAGISVHRLGKAPDGLYFFETDTNPSLAFLPYHAFESTHFSWENGKIKPRSYQYDINEGKRKRTGHIVFDWPNHKVLSMNPRDPFQYAIEDNFQDKLTHVLMLRRDLLKNRTDHFNYTVATGDKVQTYNFKMIGEEVLHTDMGKIDTIKLQTITHGTRVTTIWFAKKMHFIPVKISQQRDGKVVTSAQIISLSSFNHSTQAES